MPLKGYANAIGRQPDTDIFKGQIEMKDCYFVTKSGPAGTGCMAALGAQRFMDSRIGTDHEQPTDPARRPLPL